VAADEAPRRSVAVWVRSAVSITFVVVVFVLVLPRIADFSEVWSRIGELTGIELATIALIAVFKLVTYTFIWVASLPGLRYREAAVVANATNTVASIVPAGGAIAIGLTYSMLGSWGFSKGRTTISVLISGVWNAFLKLAMPILALALLALSGDAGGGRVVTGLLGIVALAGAVAVFAAMLHSEELAARVGIRAGRIVTPVRRLFRLGPAEGWDQATVKFRNRTVDLLRERWYWLTLATVISHFTLFTVLLVALRHVGVSNDEVSWVEVLAVFAFARLVTAIPLTPVGLGVIELALTTGLAGAGGDREAVVAGILVYRTVTYLLPLPLGALAYLFWQRNTSWRREPEPAGSVAAVTTEAPA
jgi:putative heme transporter